MKKTYVLVKTERGNMYVNGYDLGNGLFVHRLIAKDYTLMNARYYELGYESHGIIDECKILNTTKSNYWTITHGRSGMAVKMFSHTPMKLKQVIMETGKINHLDWNKNSEELGTEDYRNAVREMHGF